MAKCLNGLSLVLGLWVMVAALIFGCSMPGLVVDLCAGAVVAALSLGVVLGKEYRVGLDYGVAAVGALLVVWGVVDAVAALGGAPANEIIVGLLIALVGFGATRFAVTYDGASFYDRGGAPMVDVKSLRMKDDTILMKALLLQSMPSTVYVRPDEVWKVLTMVPFDLIKQMPGYLYKGYKECRQQQKESQTSAQ